MSVIITFNTLTPGIASLAPRISSGLAALAERASHELQSTARSDAPWQDQTSNARNGLFAKAVSTGSIHTIHLYHTMPYGIYLETRWSGRYATIMPTISKLAPQIMKDADAVLERVA